MNCSFCGKTFSSKRGTSRHEYSCKNNPNSSKVPPAWNKGKTKETDYRVAKNGKSISEAYRTGLVDSAYRSTKEYKTKMSEIAKERGFGGFQPNAGRGKREYKQNIYGEEFLLRSSYEVKVADWLNLNHILWVIPKPIWYVLDGVKKRYYPDFYIPSFDLYIETKNDFLLSIQKEKINSIRLVLDNFLIITNSDMNVLDECLGSLTAKTPS